MKHILIVEDEPDIQELLCAYIQNAGYETAAAGDGEEALTALHGPVQRLTKEERMEEFMFLGLRMVRGVSELDFAAMFGTKLTSVYGPVLERLKRDGLIQRDGVRIALTEWGMDVSNFVLSEFLL